MNHTLTLATLVFATACSGQEACPAPIDVNSNGAVDIADFLNVLGLFGDVDSDGDGVWDSQDFCTDVEACNYDASPTEPCQILDVVGLCGGACETDEDQDGVCDVHDCGQPFTYHGQTYETIQIGDRCWFAENLKTTQLQDGSDILLAQDWEGWSYQSDIETPVYCHFQADTLHSDVFGLLYNGHVATIVPSVCPVGWRVADNQDFIVLLEEAGADSVTFASSNYGGEALKATANDPHPWNGTNLLGFNGLKSGLRPLAHAWGESVWFWSGNATANWRLDDTPYMFWGADNKKWGGSIRCARDI